MTILLVYTRYRRTPTIMSGVTITKAIRKPTVPAMTLLLFEADPDSGGGALDDHVTSMLGTAVYRNTSSSVIKHSIVVA